MENKDVNRNIERNPGDCAHHTDARWPIPYLLVSLALITLSLAAQAQDLAPVSGTLNSIHGFLQGSAMRIAASLAVIGVGITAIAGYLRWRWAGSVIGGIVLIFGADQVVSFFTTAAGG